jgi:hypothetical protein
MWPASHRRGAHQRRARLRACAHRQIGIVAAGDEDGRERQRGFRDRGEARQPPVKRALLDIGRRDQQRADHFAAIHNPSRLTCRPPRRREAAEAVRGEDHRPFGALDREAFPSRCCDAGLPQAQIDPGGSAASALPDRLQMPGAGIARPGAVVAGAGPS